jgi:hypothetical protein
MWLDLCPMVTHRGLSHFWKLNLKMGLVSHSVSGTVPKELKALMNSLCMHIISAWSVEKWACNGAGKSGANSWKFTTWVREIRGHRQPQYLGMWNLYSFQVIQILLRQTKPKLTTLRAFIGHVTVSLRGSNGFGVPTCRGRQSAVLIMCHIVDVRLQIASMPRGKMVGGGQAYCTAVNQGHIVIEVFTGILSLIMLSYQLKYNSLNLDDRWWVHVMVLYTNLVMVDSRDYNYHPVRSLLCTACYMRPRHVNVYCVLFCPLCISRWISINKEQK